MRNNRLLRGLTNAAHVIGTLFERLMRVGDVLFAVACAVFVVYLGYLLLSVVYIDPGKKFITKFTEELADFGVCKQAIAEKAPYPTKVDFVEREIIKFDSLRSLRIIKGKVDFMNVYGAMIPHSFSCVVSEGGVKSIKVQEISSLRR